MTVIQLASEMVFPASGYLSMAIEAITQMWELDGGQVEQINAFELEDTALTTALVIPDDGRGVEVLLNLHPPPFNRGNDSRLRCRFLITSVVPSGGESVFVEHAHGQIGILIDEKGM